MSFYRYTEFDSVILFKHTVLYNYCYRNKGSSYLSLLSSSKQDSKRDMLLLDVSKIGMTMF